MELHCLMYTMVGRLAFGGHCLVFYDGVHTLQISKIVLDPSCDEGLLLLNEIINLTVGTVQDCIFSIFKLYVMFCTWIFRFDTKYICFEKKKKNIVMSVAKFIIVANASRF